MSAFKRAPVTGGPPRQDILAPLRAAQIVSSKPVLPAEILSTILDYLPVPDLLHFARTSKRMREMVYDDTRWVQRLRLMGCWDDAEARRRAEEIVIKRMDAQNVLHQEEAERVGIGVNGANGTVNRRDESGQPGTTIFDGTMAVKKQARQVSAKSKGPRGSLEDGFDAIDVSPKPQDNKHTPNKRRDTDSILEVIAKACSTRGHARQEYGKIYGALAPFYHDAIHCKSHTDAIVFRTYRDPGQQARMLSQLVRFAKSDISQGWQLREEKLDELVAAFEDAVSREFEQGLDTGDVEGRMRKYAGVLVDLNGGHRVIDRFIGRNPVITEKGNLGNPTDCINQSVSGGISLHESHAFFSHLSTAFNAQAVIIDRVFPPSVDVALELLRRVGNEVVADYLTTLFDEAHQRNMESYLKAVSGTYEQALNFAKSLQPTQISGDEFYEALDQIIVSAYEPHIDLYLNEELEFFKLHADTELGNWERQLSEQDASMQSLFMSNVNRQADKRDFLSSFKKVVMMPVNVLPSFGGKPATAKALVNGESLEAPQLVLSQASSRPSTPSNVDASPLGSARTSTPEPPTTELAAKAAIMNSRLEGIRSLFSIEVALNLVHAAKSGIERTAGFVRLEGQLGENARTQCEAIFILLLQTLGSRHIKAGFDQAVEHLSNYNPREVSEHSQPGVAPLVTFLELVNVGDLIQQMLDVFYEQGLIATKLTDRSDFLDPAVKEKKRFEQMLDERVAAGLNKGIEALMAEVEYICATTQTAEDFNHGASGDVNNRVVDIGPSKTARQVVEVVSSHTKMLVGSTDKNMLDVFNQEVGLRLFATLCKHLKRQRISVDGSVKLISDMNHYFTYIQTLKNQDLLLYFIALRELSQIYLIDPSDAKELATLIADGDRFHGIFRAEEVYEFAERRADWYQVKRRVERAMYGIGCRVM
ncbi:MAG: secretion pathway Sls2 Rcy1 [Lasallia pustulata]|uniref:Secretion pathway Sls2 Rcy1 n=1 Tax=Lasallia pustulata TaxID=136370 RepID=A0A5M8PQY2_9LECA|nr:MAG: secretion pathway Sls2 Rcy1 [Lasallia pustulata]